MRDVAQNPSLLPVRPRCRFRAIAVRLQIRPTSNLPSAMLRFFGWRRGKSIAFLIIALVQKTLSVYETATLTEAHNGIRFFLPQDEGIPLHISVGQLKSNLSRHSPVRKVHLHGPHVPSFIRNNSMDSRKLLIKFSCMAGLCIGTMALAGCGGGSSDSAPAAGTTTTTLAVSSIQLPTQVQVVSSK